MTKNTKSRIVEVSNGFIPQIYTKYFPWGGEWVGLAVNEYNDLYSYTSESAQLDKCVHDTYESADETRLRYFARLEDKSKLSKR